MGYINAEIGYYVGDKISHDDLEVIDRPSQYHDYVNGEWVFSETLKRQFIPILSAWQVRKILTQVGLRATVEAAIASADQNTKDAWQYANAFTRDDAVLNAMATNLGMSDTELDNLFIAGALL